MKNAPQMIKCIVAVIGLCWFSVIAFAQTPHTHQHGFTGAEQWAQVFDDPDRDKWQKPHEVIQALGLKPDSTVADIGAGTGYFATRLAHMVPQGTVYGVDTEPDMVKYLSDRAKKLDLKNLMVLQSKSDSPQLPQKVDLVMFVDVFHHVESRPAYLEKIRASLKPNGRIAVIDFKMDGPIGPPKEGRISPDQVKADLKNAGFSLIQEPDFLPNQYFLIFQ
ncbi:MAG: class I SAM-dependent methyltransferase [Sheuella sp.]|nr:class I SAM-dependent methyltransferase [Sheuella sp.]